MSNQHNIKLKLDQLMNELNNNLPEINFEDVDNENDESKVEINESDLNMFRDVNEDDEEYSKLNSLLNNNKFDFENDILDNYDDNNDIITSKNLDELKDLKLTFSANIFNCLNSNESNLSSAEQITKNIFNGKNSKLSMEKFNSLNIEEAFNTLNQKNSNESMTSTKWYASLVKNPSTSSSISNNDENVLKKLAEMSMQISSNSELNNLNSKSGAKTSFNSSMVSLQNVNSTILNALENNQNSNSNNPFDLIEKQLTQNSINRSNDMFNQDLDKFLKSHNIKDGNMIETRRIDLRASQHQDYTKKDPDNKIKSLFDNIITQTNQNNSNTSLKFLNEATLSSNESSNESSDEESDSNENLLWIERYRRHKMNLHNKNNNAASN
jgi:hypothetical protein